MKCYTFDSWDNYKVSLSSVHTPLICIYTAQYNNNINIGQISKLNETEYTLFNIRLKTKLKMPEGLKT